MCVCFVWEKLTTSLLLFNDTPMGKAIKKVTVDTLNVRNRSGNKIPKRIIALGIFCKAFKNLLGVVVLSEVKHSTKDN